ncbi:hypothetical protein OG936_15965 [Streptomyces sp. NBC_00846]|uniref:hypothetical protein n=1 Tax=Streptomyces sp. NBC_00846 TaxID=2975849 RepID=UPI00386CE35B|nr:hypothetical protein OG936_15965 [Streptomyces sp. NBC_00846]
MPLRGLPKVYAPFIPVAAYGFLAHVLPHRAQQLHHGGGAHLSASRFSMDRMDRMDSIDSMNEGKRPVTREAHG